MEVAVGYGAEAEEDLEVARSAAVVAVKSLSIGVGIFAAWGLSGAAIATNSGKGLCLTSKYESKGQSAIDIQETSEVLTYCKYILHVRYVVRILGTLLLEVPQKNVPFRCIVRPVPRMLSRFRQHLAK